MQQEGYTLMHEHLALDLSGVKEDLDCRLDDFEAMIADGKELYGHGVRHLLEVTALGMGRNLSFCQHFAQETGIQVLFATGFYKEPFLPPDFWDKSDEEWIEFFIRELEEGVGDTGIPAHVIGEFGTSHHVITEAEMRIFNICMEAALHTGAVVSTHTTLGTFALEQVKMLLDRGLDPKKIIIGHQDLCSDLDLLKQVLQFGVNIGWDTIGKENYQPDAMRAQHLLALRDAGFIDQIVLSTDITRKSQLKAYGGYGRSHLFEHFIPLCRKVGLTEQDMQQLLAENPKRILDLSKRRGTI